jgi:hypothetical protein
MGALFIVQPTDAMDSDAIGYLNPHSSTTSHGQFLVSLQIKGIKPRNR